jgi:hypothetical protein
MTMTDDQLRAKASGYLAAVSGRHRPDLGYSDLPYPHDICAAFARRLLDLLPPPDENEPVTGDWLKAVGFRGDNFKNPWFVLQENPALGLSVRFRDGTCSLWMGGSTQHNPTRGHVRRLCAALDFPLKEPSPCPTPSQSSGTAAATGCGATGPDTASC